MGKLLAYVVLAPWFLIGPLFAQAPILCGDANRDGEVTLTDVVLALRFAVRLQNPAPWQGDALDFNRNGRIDVAEVRSVIRKLVDPCYRLEGGFRCLAGQTAKVVRVIDGDTIEVQVIGGDTIEDRGALPCVPSVRLEQVRYIGMNAPEAHQPLGPAATAKNRELVEGKTVILEKDVSERDRYGRLLRYVWVGTLLVNAELVRLGYAQVMTVPPDVKYQQVLLLAQQEAQTHHRGLWAGEPPQKAPTPPCDPSYPDVCIPPPPPDLDCKDVLPLCQFRVLPPDPHHFDGDRDGIGCEKCR